MQPKPASQPPRLMTLRQQLEAIIEAAIDVLDELDGEADREDDGAAEPWLGWTKGGAIGNRFDLEENHHAA